MAPDEAPGDGAVAMAKPVGERDRYQRDDADDLVHHREAEGDPEQNRPRGLVRFRPAMGELQDDQQQERHRDVHADVMGTSDVDRGHRDHRSTEQARARAVHAAAEPEGPVDGQHGDGGVGGTPDHVEGRQVGDEALGELGRRVDPAKQQQEEEIDPVLDEEEVEETALGVPLEIELAGAEPECSVDLESLVDANDVRQTVAESQESQESGQ